MWRHKCCKSLACLACKEGRFSIKQLCLNRPACSMAYYVRASVQPAAPLQTPRPYKISDTILPRACSSRSLAQCRSSCAVYITVLASLGHAHKCCDVPCSWRVWVQLTQFVSPDASLVSVMRSAWQKCMLRAWSCLCVARFFWLRWQIV